MELSFYKAEDENENVISDKESMEDVFIFLCNQETGWYNEHTVERSMQREGVEIA